MPGADGTEAVACPRTHDSDQEAQSTRPLGSAIKSTCDQPRCRSIVPHRNTAPTSPFTTERSVVRPPNQEPLREGSCPGATHRSPGDSARSRQVAQEFRAHEQAFEAVDADPLGVAPPHFRHRGAGVQTRHRLFLAHELPARWKEPAHVAGRARGRTPATAARRRTQSRNVPRKGGHHDLDIGRARVAGGASTRYPPGLCDIRRTPGPTQCGSGRCDVSRHHGRSGGRI